MEAHNLKILGLMSGTSLDGLDLALCSFPVLKGKWEYIIHAAETIAYPSEWVERLSLTDNLSANELALLHVEYGNYLGMQSLGFLQRQGQKADYISSHGHTLFHQPGLGLTFQIGSGAAISGISNLPIICDFRSQDLALGGQGAPLVPMGDELLFGSYNYCLNLGGFSNISYPKEGKRLAFDISPCNLVLNMLASKEGNLYDEDGRIAANGQIDKMLLNHLDNLDHYSKKGPKSLGREWVEQEIFPLLETFPIPVSDLMRTMVEHISNKIAWATQLAGSGSVLVTGGGAKNKFLMEKIREKSISQIIIPDVMCVDFKEALVFAFLGLLRVKEVNNILSSVTGSSKDHCGGCIYLV